MNLRSQGQRIVAQITAISTLFHLHPMIHNDSGAKNVPYNIQSCNNREELISHTVTLHLL